MFHIAATLGCTVTELGVKLSATEYRQWMLYFERINAPADERRGVDPNDEVGLLAEIGKFG